MYQLTSGEHIKLFTYVYFINVILFRAKTCIYLINFTSSSVGTTSPKSLALQSEFDFTGIVSFHLQIFFFL
ncbi:hypothetical protein MtrunA17_Chr8g0368581 [Medicago truncatula]|uniref:Transmembrane protein n=1 Tax=Medicago truncatula TaxID=3880 RepID=A0A396GSC8_MEDTR|nr:hypothetical protein MtrunA17_Chr8g0368581 [Medicago truncatula]